MDNIWPFPPQRGIQESLEWVTEVIRCKAAEQRLCLRPYPRTSIASRYQLLPQEIEAATSLARTLGSEEFLLPFWQEAENVGTIASGTSLIPVNTDSRRYRVGEKAFLIGFDGKYEILIISGVNPDSIEIAEPFVVTGAAGAFLMPCFPARFKVPFSFQKYPATYFTASAEFILTKDYGITELNGYPVFNGSFVLTDRPVIEGSSSESHYREFESFQNLAGPLFYSNTYDYPISTGELGWSFDNHADSWNFRRFLYTLKGKVASFYTPRWTRDFIPMLTLQSGDSFIIAKENDYLDDSYIGPICLVLNNGGMLYRMVTGWEYYSSGLRKMLLSSVIGQQIFVPDIEMITRMTRMRANTDTNEFSYTTGKVEIRLPVIEVPE